MVEFLKAIKNSIGRYMKGRSSVDRVNLNVKGLERKKFVFNTVRGNVNNNHLSCDLLIGNQLAKNGARVYVLLDDGELEHWDAARQSHNPKYLSPYEKGSFERIRHYIELHSLLKAFQHPNLSIIFYEDIMKDIPTDKFSLKKSDHKDAKKSTVRFFEVGRANLENYEQREYYEKSLNNCKVSKAVGKYVVNKLQPDLFLTSHGFYSTWGGAYREVKKSEIKTTVYSLHSYRDGFIHLKQNGKTHNKQPDYIRYKNKGIGKVKKQKAKKILKKRVNLNDRNASIHFSQYEGKYKNIRLKKRDGQKVIAAFPNVAWDAISEKGSSIFRDVIHWMVHTVKYIRRKKNKLVIRFHPSESSVLEGARPFYSILKERIDGLDKIENVVLIGSHENVNTYEFAKKNVDVGILYNGSLGCELPYLDIPAIGVSNGRFDSGFVYKPKNITQYEYWISNPEILIEDFDSNKTEALNSLFTYVYYIYFENAYRVPALSKQKPNTVDFNHLRKCLRSDGEMSQFKETIREIKNKAD